MGGVVYANNTVTTTKSKTDSDLSITINSQDPGHQYEAYQIFVGDLTIKTTKDGENDGEGNLVSRTKTLSNIEWGNGVAEADREKLIDALKADKTLNPDGSDNDISKLVSKTDGTAGTTQSSAADVANAIASVVESNAQGTRDANGDFVSNQGGDTEKGKIVAQILGQYATQNAKSFTENKNASDTSKTDNYTLRSLNPGYYLIQDKKDTQGTSTTPAEDGDYTRIILEVVGDETVKPKTSAPTVEKKVLDEKTAWQDTAIWGSQDTISYKITGTLPSDFANYATYTTYTFTDTVTNGLDLLDSTGAATAVGSAPAVTVLLHSGASTDTDFYDTDAQNSTKTLKTGYTDITSLFDVSNLASADGYPASSDTGKAKTFTVSLKTTGVTPKNESTAGAVDLKKTYTIGTTDVTFNKDSNIIVIYTAKLNDASVQVGDYGNPNKVKLTYSNNPNVDHSGDKGETPEDEVTVFTLEIVPTKYKDSASSGNELSGATFLVYKDSAAKANVIGVGTSGSDGKIQFYEASAEATDPDPTTGYYKVTVGAATFYVKNETTSDRKLRVKAGKYVLSEIVTPSGYNTMSDITMTVTATSGANTGADKATHPFIITASNVNTGNTAGTASSLQFNDIKNGDNDATHTATVTTSGKIEGSLINKAGNLLPNTGGIGTTIFYVIGGCVVAAALALLVVRKRRSSN